MQHQGPKRRDMVEAALLGRGMHSGLSQLVIPHEPTGLAHQVRLRGLQRLHLVDQIVTAVEAGLFDDGHDVPVGVLDADVEFIGRGAARIRRHNAHRYVPIGGELQRLAFIERVDHQQGVDAPIGLPLQVLQAVVQVLRMPGDDQRGH